MRTCTRGLLLVAGLALAGSAFAAQGVVEEAPVQQGYGTGPYGGYGPIGPATSPAVVVPYLAPNGTTVYPIMMGKSSVKPGPNSTVKVNYRGWLEDGTEFDSSYSRGQPAVFELNKTIACWQQGLQTVPVGSKVKLVCPAATAYGANQVGNIPPNSTLTYEVELLEVMN